MVSPASTTSVVLVRFSLMAVACWASEGEIATDQIRTVDKSRLKRKIGDLNFSEIGIIIIRRFQGTAAIFIDIVYHSF